MKIQIRKSHLRGQANHGWLKAKHTFSFASYYDPSHMGFSVLRVINEDEIDGGKGFGTHGHQDMEIITYIVEGALEHRDSMGNSTVMRPGEVQRMSAGTGVMHSEMNHLKDQVTHLLQIWILPEKNGVSPSYGQKNFTDQFQTSDLILVASRDAREGSVLVNQDLSLYAAKSLHGGEKIHETSLHRHLWIQVIKGEVTANGEKLGQGDGAAIEEVTSLTLKWSEGSEFLFFDMP